MQVRKQVLMHRHGKLCDGPNECVIAVTGPAQYKSSMESAATRLGCEVNPAVYPYFRGCTRSRSGAVAGTFVCADKDVRVTTWITRGWDCGIAFHRHCVTTRKRQSCSGVDARNKSEHYTDAANQRKYFHLDVRIPSLIPGALRPALVGLRGPTVLRPRLSAVLEGAVFSRFQACSTGSNDVGGCFSIDCDVWHEDFHLLQQIGCF